ncbi:MAG TPA: DUF2007 domain-containing protein [Verrucomicrobiae bacterium]|nr:DUF2007 domain-containing protein [Verrucomicrobiae bacterium]
MVTVARCGDIAEAMRLKMALESQGIAVFIPDEYTATNAPYRFLTDPSGVRIQVAEKDAESARKIVANEAKS